MAAETNEELLIQVERAVAIALQEMVGNRKYLVGTSEDARTVQLVSMLRMAGFPAVHDRKIGGHTDISISLLDNFLWIAEAKNWRGPAWAFKGLRQLLTRYATGMPGQENGAVILYIDYDEASGFVTKWREALEKLQTEAHAIGIVQPLQFSTKHTHVGAGTQFTVKHIGVPLFWGPDDD